LLASSPIFARLKFGILGNAPSTISINDEWAMDSVVLTPNKKVIYRAFIIVEF